MLSKKGDPRSVSLHSGLGNALLKMARYDDAALSYSDMLKVAEHIGQCEMEAQSWLALAKVYDRQGKHQNALDCSIKAAKIAIENNCNTETANAVLMQGQQYYRLGEVDQAEPLIEKALELHQDRDDQAAVGRCLSLMGLIYDVRGDFKTAREYKEKALDIFKEMNDPHAQWWVGNITLNLAISSDLRGDYEEAVELYEKSIGLMEEFADHDWMRLPLFSLGATQVSMGDYKQGEDNLGEVLELVEDAEWLGLSLVYYYLAESYLGQGLLNYAEKSAREALRLAEESGAQEPLGAAWRALGKIASRSEIDHLKMDNKKYSAKDCFQTSEEIFREIGGDAERAITLKAWARHEIDHGDNQKGDKMWDEAKKVFQRLDMEAEVKRMG